MQRAVRSRGKRRGLAALAAITILAGIVTSTTPSAADHLLSPSSFNASDGNQIDDGSTETDWESLLPNTTGDNLFIGRETNSGGSDNSLAGGTKDNTECPSSTTGSIPPNKDDLLRFYLYHETLPVPANSTTNTDTFLYLGYVRALPGSTTASAHGVFELNKSNVKCTNNADFYQRSVGDARIAFDDEGGNEPVISYQLWQEPCPGNKPNNAAGCWTAKTVLDEHKAEGSFNAGQIQDRLLTDTGSTTLINPEQFAEMKINMDAAGLLNSSDCVGFGAAGLFTGSSGNTDQEQSKDYIAPVPININNCQPATINVTKRDGSTTGPLLAGATIGLYNDTTNNDVFDATGPNADTLATVGTGSDANPCETNATDDPSCTWIVTGIGTKNYIIHESVVPSGYTAAPDIPLDITFSGNSQTINRTMVDPRAPRNLIVRKVDDDDPAVGVGGAVFQLYRDNPDGNAVSGTFGAEDTAVSGKTCTTSSTPGVNLGNCTITGVDTGASYWVVETTRPANYSADPTASVCTIGGVAKSCRLVAVPVGTGDIGPTGLTFVNPREFRVVTFVCRESDDTLYSSSVNIDGGTSESSISTVPPVLANDGVTAAELCTAWPTNGARFDDQGRGLHDSDVTIPQ